ncbi:MAG: DUF177 domain-containing protein [Candidatus Choladocola sp.]|nr:DUF177 domain-containing protein [Candidatus Choladocola sp.]
MLDLTEVILNEGKVIHRDADLNLESLAYRFGTFKITEKSPLSLTVENAGDRKLVLNGSTVLAVQIPCARCLKPVDCRLEIQFDLETDLNEKDYIDGYNLDVDQLVHDEALLVWPERVLCREDCKGLCSTCGQNLNDGSCDCERTDLDPRMAKILDIFSNFKEV